MFSASNPPFYALTQETFCPLWGFSKCRGCYLCDECSIRRFQGVSTILILSYCNVLFKYNAKVAILLLLRKIFTKKITVVRLSSPATLAFPGGGVFYFMRNIFFLLIFAPERLTKRLTHYHITYVRNLICWMPLLLIGDNCSSHRVTQEISWSPGRNGNFSPRIK